MDDQSRFDRIGIFGLGLMGGSIALAARRAWPEASLSGVDIDEEVVHEALRRRIVDEGSTGIEALVGADLVVLAAPVLANVAALAALAKQGGEGALLTDAGSTKRCMLAAARAAGCQRRFVGGHPLAGIALGGLAHASGDLFAGRKWLITPEDETPPAEVARLRRFVSGLGAIPHALSAEDHDRVMAAVSHLPQLVASALMQVAGEMAGEEGLALAGPGLADTTRLASSPADIWKDICATNADHVSRALGEMIGALQGLRDDLPDGDLLGRVFAGAQGWRDRLGPPEKAWPDKTSWAT